MSHYISFLIRDVEHHFACVFKICISLSYKCLLRIASHSGTGLRDLILFDPVPGIFLFLRIHINKVSSSLWEKKVKQLCINWQYSENTTEWKNKFYEDIKGFSVDVLIRWSLQKWQLLNTGMNETGRIIWRPVILIYYS